MAWDVLSGAAKMAWDVLSGVTKTAWDVLSGVANRCGCFVRGGAKNGMGCFVPGCFVLHSRLIEDPIQCGCVRGVLLHACVFW